MRTPGLLSRGTSGESKDGPVRHFLEGFLDCPFQGWGILDHGPDDSFLLIAATHGDRAKKIGVGKSQFNLVQGQITVSQIQGDLGDPFLVFGLR